MKTFALSLLMLLAASVTALADAQILPMRERAAVIDQLLDDRIQTVLPGLMRRAGIDMWVNLAVGPAPYNPADLRQG